MSTAVEHDMATAEAALNGMLERLDRTISERGAWQTEEREEPKGTVSPFEQSCQDQITRTFGERFSGCTLDNYEVSDPGQEKAVKVCRYYLSKVDEFVRLGKSIVFAGKPGTGKDHLAVSVAREIIRAGYRVYSDKFYCVVDDALEAQKNGAWRKAKSVNECVRSEYLVLGEVGLSREGGQTAFEQKVLYHIVDERYRAFKPFILTTNLNQKDMMNAFDPAGYGRIWDRVQEIAAFIAFTWESYRTPKKGNSNG